MKAEERTRGLRKHDWTHQQELQHEASSSLSLLRMVRNIDLPEALIFYGLSAVVDNSTGEQRDGLQAILRECAEIDTATVLLVTQRPNREMIPPGVRRPAATFTAVHWQQVTAPNPADLLDCVRSITVQPRPFGGSSGFGSQPADPERNPLPCHCVAFTTTTDQTRAARAAGMRVIALDRSSMDDVLADAVIASYEDINGLDDLATPGSFWLNPPCPRDDEGNAVDPEWLASCVSAETAGVSSEILTEEMDDEDLKAILADMAPLQQ